jgi:WD40 repeat protein
LAKIQALVLPTSVRRQRAASLVSEDYPFLLTTLPSMEAGTAVFDPAGMVLTTAVGAGITQFSLTAQGVQIREPWSVTALEVSPLVRRVIVDRKGSVSRIGLTLNISHSRLSDLRIKIIAPSGRTVEIETEMEQASSGDDIRISSSQLQDLLGESLSGTWSISVRDESLGVAGQLVGWNLKLNSQGAIEYFQRGLNIPDPVERETDDIWFESSGRYAVARAMQSDSARIWDLAFAEPVRAIALHESEVLIGIDASARRLVSATQDSVNLWDTATGDRIATLPVGAASAKAVLTPDRSHLFVERRSDVESRLELWSLDEGTVTGEVVVAGVPSLVAIDAAGTRVAVADFDRAIRVWDFATNELVGQFDLPAQPGEISLSADGSTLGAVYPNIGLTLWNVANPQQPFLQEFGDGFWQMSFSPSGNMVAAGRPETGFQIFKSDDGRLIGPPLGVRKPGSTPDLLEFSQDEQVLLSGSADNSPRMWRVPVSNTVSDTNQQASLHTIWTPAADRPLAVSPDGGYVAIGDDNGHVHVIPSGASLGDIAAISNDVSFVGHSSGVRSISISPSGTLVASVAADNTLRIWRASNGEPLALAIEISGPPISHIAFSPDDGYVGLLGGNRVSLVNINGASVVAEFDSASAYSGLTFAADLNLYLGAEDGALHLVSRGVDSNWKMQQVWQGPEGIRLLRASPRGDSLVLIDRNNLASQFVLSESRIGDATLQLPSDVLDLAFDSNGARVYFRAARWVHRVSSSQSGLNWMDAQFVARPLNGAGLVRGNGTDESKSGHKMYLPVASNSYIELVELSFSGSTSPGLFGNRFDLVKEWQSRVNATPLEGS